MAARPDKFLNNSAIVTRTVKAASSVTKGYGVKFDATDPTTCLNCSAGERAQAIALETGAAGARVQLYLINGGGIVPVKVGTGGATAGAAAITVSDGLTDRALGGGTVSREIAGFFVQTGIAGDEVGLLPAPFSGVSS